MSLLAALAQQSAASVTPPVEPPNTRPDSTLIAPYNAKSYITFPTPYAHPSATHPSVIDFGKDGWNGWRYWMVHTPYYGANDAIENPIIVVSNDRLNWQYPEGITNPIEPRPTEAGYNSDTELVWDSAEQTMWCVWRTTIGGTDESIRAKSSKDGVNWSERIELFRSGGYTFTLSPTIVKDDDGLWRMYSVGRGGPGPAFRTAPRLSGPWSDPRPIRFAWNGASGPWHMFMIRENGQYRMLLNMMTPVSGLCAAVSDDGVNFRAGPVLLQPREAWEGDRIYRSCMVPADNGADYDVWYAATGSGWQIAHTQIPAKHWDDL